ncbi:MAG: AMP-binding protein, partial [Bacteroidales bacterium]|nr:AMP-binding protein [Bacteroidales bacterium]
KSPFTEKKDLQLFNDDFLFCDKSDIIDYVTTSGTLGDPVTFGCTEKDLQRLAFNEKKSFECAGVKKGDVVQLMTTLDKRFMAGMAYFLGLRELGAGIIRVGNGIPELQWDTIRRIKPDTIMCVPSFILRLIQYAEEHGIDYRNSSVKRIIGIGEGLRDQNFELNLLGKSIKSKWDVDLFATYSSTEMGATFSECEFGQGGHVHPELIIVEIIGEDDMPVPDGQVGEVVVTTLGVEGMPLLRFRTGDMAAKRVEQCQCGRYSYRLTPLVGRKNNMIKLKGTTIYPPAINDVLDNADYVQNYVVYVMDTEAGTDDVLVKVGLKSEPEFDVEKDLKDRFRSRIRVAPRVEVLPVEEISKITSPAKSRKPIKFIDIRKK